MKSYLNTKDFSVSQEAFELFHDEELDMLITKPQPDDLARYYESENYISHTDAKKTLVDKMYQLVKRYSLSKKTKLIAKYFAGEKTLLDVGAGTGDFLLAAKKEGWTITGVEPNSDARTRAKEKGVEILPAIDVLTNKKFGVISLWHVLEHLPNLEEQLSILVSHLAADGTLVIAVPNFKSYDATYYKEYWAAYDVPRHLWHFSREAIEKLLAKHEMKLVATKPMVFDAFYVAMLSEKYKTGKQNLLKAFWVGLQSNRKAMRTKEYSSLIYVLKKA